MAKFHQFLSIDIIKIWFRIVICPSVIFFPDIFATMFVIHKQIIAVAGYYACGAFIKLHIHIYSFVNDVAIMSE